MSLARLFSICKPSRLRRSSSTRLRMECLEDRSVLSTFTVLNLADSGPGSLRAAVSAAEVNPGADVIDFANGVTGTITLTNGELVITSDLTIDGPGANKLTVSGNDASRIANVVGGADANHAITVSISGLTIADGRADHGGGIHNANFSDLTLSGVVLTENVAVGLAGLRSASGAAVRSAGIGNSLSVFDSLVVGNTADGVPNAITAFGGGITIASGSLTVLNCTIADNRALAGDGEGAGGGIFGLGTSLTIANSVVSGNQAISTSGAGDGGGIVSILGSLNVANSTISDNLAAGAPGDLSYGGGVEVALGTSSFINCTISRNQAIGGADGGFAFGGGVFAENATADVRSCVITDNLARAGDSGRGAFALGGGIYDGSSVSISNSLLMGNRAIAGSGGTRSGNDFSVSTAVGGAIFNSSGARLEISQSTLRGNEAIGGNYGTHNAVNFADVGAAHGGAIYNELSAEAIVRDSTIEHNRAIGGHHNSGTGASGFVGTATGGGIDNALDFALYGLDSSPAKLTLINSTLTDNEAIGGDDNTGNGTMLFVGGGLGGSIANYLGAITEIINSRLDHNGALGGERNVSNSGSVLASLGAGGAIFNALGNFQLDAGEILAPSIVNVTNSTLEHNVAQGGSGGGDGWGGAIASLFDADTTVLNSILAKNHAIGGEANNCGNGGNGHGGGAYNDGTSSLTLNASIVTKNHVNGGDGDHGDSDGEGIGGGVYNLGDFDFDLLAMIFANHATTDHDDVFDLFA